MDPAVPEQPVVPEDATPTTDAVREAKRKRRLAQVFGDVLPDDTRDDRPDESGDRDGGAGNDDWLRSQVPPHHGG